MMKSIAILSVLTTVALAQSSASSTAAATPSANPLIPAGVSSGCKSFLISLDSDTSLSSCTTPLITATSQFGPGANSASTSSSAAISSALDNICGSANSCSEQALRSKLTDFYSACTAELTSNANSDVIKIYDVFYALIPLKNAVCTKNPNDKYCVTEITMPSDVGASGANVDIAVSSNSVSSIKDYLWTQVSKTKRATAQTPAMIPNTTTYRNNNILFFFLQPKMDSTTLCTACTRSVLMSYFNFEQSVPYGPGISNSLLMGGQMDLYNAVNNACGSDFFSGAVQAAGGLSGGLGAAATSAAIRSVSQSFGGVVTVVMGTVALGTVAFGFAAIL